MISSKNKKAEILDAYFELLDELNELKKVDSVSLLTPRQYQQDFQNRMKITITKFQNYSLTSGSFLISSEKILGKFLSQISSSSF